MQQQKSKGLLLLVWIARLAAAVILLQTLYFKFSAAGESVYIFTRLGIEPWGRIGSGVVELIASVLILIPATTAIGALLGLGTMAGALFSHLAVLGIAVKNNDGSSDGGLLFFYAVIVFLSCLFLAVFYRKQIPVPGKLF